MLSDLYRHKIFLVVVICLAGCSKKVSDLKLPYELPESFSNSGTSELQDKWWMAFNDDELNTLIDTALIVNPSVLAVYQRFVASEAVVDRAYSGLLPELAANLRSAFNRPQPDFVGGENLQYGLSAFYEVDLWGRIRENMRAEKFRSAATYEEYQTAAISLSSEISLTWYRLIAANFQLRLLENQVENNKKILELIKAQFGSGQVRSVDILRQQQLIASTLDQKIFFDQQVQLLRNQLSVLIGRPPQTDINVELDSFPQLPQLPYTGIPTELVQRRPDIQQAYRQLQAADMDAAAAVSNLYPRLSFNTSVQLRANNAQELFQDWAYTLAGNLVAPLFYGGRLRAEVDRTEAIKQQRLYEYGQTVLIAFREVEDALIQEQKQRESLDVINEQVDFATKAYQQLRYEYFNGIGDYLAVLTAQDQLQQLQRDQITAQLSLIEFRISLYRALAGSFANNLAEEES